MNKIFSGIRASGKLHLGNYLGAIKNWIALQNDPQTEQAVFAVVDYHGITTPFDPKTYRQQVLDVILDYLAAGVDPDKALLIRQSKVPAHTELAWIFNTITPVSWLDRLPTYKEKLQQAPKYHNMGLLDYPVLMAADILVYKTNLVPVGEDQLPHIDLTNEIAKKFNHMFGETFPAVKTELAPGHRIMSLQDPRKKMSKTPNHPSGAGATGQAGDESCIFLADSSDTVREKIKRATTDSGKEILFDEKKKPGIANLMEIYALLDPGIRNLREIEKRYEDKSYVDFKKDLAEVVVNFLSPFQQKYQELSRNMDYVEKVLTESEEKARVISNDALREVKEKVGV